MSVLDKRPNVDEEVAAGFGDEWARFDQSGLEAADHARIFEDYFHLFPFSELGRDAVGMDVGCGSGRWARLVAPRVGRLVCVDASAEAIEVARRNLSDLPNVEVREASVGALPVEDGSLDFAYSLGVLHHVPDTPAAVAALARKIKPGAPLLLYLYYDFENRSRAYRQLWRLSEHVRGVVSKAPYGPRYAVSQALAVSVYWPLARLSWLGERVGADVSSWPLSYYRDKGFYVMRTDALDRFGTRLEQRFSRSQIAEMLDAAGCHPPTFSERPPYWVALARRR